MDTLRIQQVTFIESEGLLTATLMAGEQAYPIHFLTRDTPLSPNLEGLVAGVLPICMALGWHLSAQGAVSRRFLENLPQLQEALRPVNPDAPRVHLYGVTATERKPPLNHRTALFFNGGVNSFLTLLDHGDEVTDLLFVQGQELVLAEKKARDQISQTLHWVGQQVKKNVIEIDTNLAGWYRILTRDTRPLSTGLAAAALLLTPQINRVLLPVAENPQALSPGKWISLCNSEALEFEPIPIELTLVEALERISENPVVQGGLRVCSLPPNRTLNCGRCMPCLLSMSALRSLGRLEQFRVFEHPLDLKHLAETDASQPPWKSQFEQVLQRLEGASSDLPLQEALRSALQTHHKQPFWRKFISR